MITQIHSKRKQVRDNLAQNGYLGVYIKKRGFLMYRKKHHQLIRILGKNPFATTKLFWDTQQKEFFVVKRAYKQDPLSVYLLRKECALLSMLSHSMIPACKGFDQRKTSFRMEYIHGETLDKKWRKEGPFPFSLIRSWGISLCEVLHYLHSQEQPLVYRDLKPQNIMVTKQDTLVLIDFGAVRRYQPDKKEDTFLLGSKGYAAPELYGGMGQSDLRCDIYSLGVLMYRLWDKERDGRLWDILDQCTQYRPQNRYQSCLELKKDLIEKK